jgi:hypothetical protein
VAESAGVSVAVSAWVEVPVFVAVLTGATTEIVAPLRGAPETCRVFPLVWPVPCKLSFDARAVV